jgi:antitoxin MazE6
MRTAISIPDLLLKAVERLAGRLRLSRSEIFRRAIQAFLQDHHDAAVTAALNEVYGSDKERPRLDPVVLRLQTSSLRADKW